MTLRDHASITDRRAFLQACGALFAGAALHGPGAAEAQGAHGSFEQWRDAFRPRALARGVSEATYNRVMVGLKPDTSVYALKSNQDEFKEVLWQYLNRRVSDWRVITGKERVREFSSLLDRLEKDYGVDRSLLVSIWGIESSYGEVIGKVANYDDYDNGTTYHLHFDAQVPTRNGWVLVNPYMTLVAAYERLIGARGREISDEPLPQNSSASHDTVGAK